MGDPAGPICCGQLLSGLAGTIFFGLHGEAMLLLLMPPIHWPIELSVFVSLHCLQQLSGLALGV